MVRKLVLGGCPKRKAVAKNHITFLPQRGGRKGQKNMIKKGEIFWFRAFDGSGAQCEALEDLEIGLGSGSIGDDICFFKGTGMVKLLEDYFEYKKGEEFQISASWIPCY
jgi:hypothetical protein